MELAGIATPEGMQGESFLDVLAGTREEHRPFVVSSWPLYFAKGEITLAVDSRPRRIANYMPLTVTTRDRTLIIGGPDEKPELYDLSGDPGEQTNVWEANKEEGAALMRRVISFLERQGTPEEYLVPRRIALQMFAPASVWGDTEALGGERDPGRWAEKEAG
jgi:hypothetical protein